MVRALRATTLVSILAALVACATTPWDRARQIDQIAAYQQFVAENPGDPHVPEAKAREAELAFQALGEKPTLEGLRAYVEKYPSSELAEKARGMLIDPDLERAIAERDLDAIGPLAQKATRADLKQEADEVVRYFTGARDALKGLKLDYFQDYLRTHSSGDLADDARRSEAWIKSVMRPRAKALKVQFDGNFLEDRIEEVRKRFKLVGATVEVVPDIKKALTAEGEIGYRFADAVAGKKMIMHGADGQAVQLKPEQNGAAGEVWIREKGELRVIWGYAVEPDGPAERKPTLQNWQDFPLMSWDTRLAKVHELKTEEPLASASRAGDKLVVAVPSGLDFYRLTLPSHPRAIRRFREEARAADAMPRIASTEQLIARYGEGVSLVVVDEKKAQVNDHASPDKVGKKVASGAFDGLHFFFSSEGGFWAMHPEWLDPKLLGSGKFSLLAKIGKGLVGASPVGLTLYTIAEPGSLGTSKHLDPEQYPNYLIGTSGFVSATDDGPDLLLANEDGQVTVLRNFERLDGAGIDRKQHGWIRFLTASSGRLITLGPAGVSLFHRAGKAWKWIGTVPMTGCNDAELFYPYAYLTCGKKIVTIHLAALELRPAS